MIFASFWFEKVSHLHVKSPVTVARIRHGLSFAFEIQGFLSISLLDIPVVVLLLYCTVMTSEILLRRVTVPAQTDYSMASVEVCHLGGREKSVDVLWPLLK